MCPNIPHPQQRTADPHMPHMHGVKCPEHTESERIPVLLKPTNPSCSQLIHNTQQHILSTYQGSHCVSHERLAYKYRILLVFLPPYQSRIYPSTMIEYPTLNINASIHWGFLNEAGQITSNLNTLILQIWNTGNKQEFERVTKFLELHQMLS